MAYIFREKRRKPIPENAEIIRRRGGKAARWTTAHGRTLTAAVDGDSVIIEGRVYVARWRDASGIMRTESTGCKTADMAQRWLDSKTSEAERITAGVVTASEAATAEKSSGAIADAVDAWQADMKAKGRSAQHIRECGHVVNNAADACGWNQLRGMERNAFERYLQSKREPTKDGDVIGARTYNKNISIAHAFGAWCQRRGMLMMNPFHGLERLNQKTDRRRERRTLTAGEVDAICTAARTRAADSWKGENRATAYRIMSASGLRWNEARTLRLSDIHLKSKTPYIELRAGNEKNRKGAQIPLHGAIVAELASFITARNKTLVGDCGASIVAFPSTAKDAPLFDALPQSISVVFAADVKGAGIASPDERGRVVDAHCLRYHFASQLAASGCPVHILQKLMRHSTVDLSMRVYVHTRLDDLSDAVQRLQIGGAADAEKQAATATKNTTSDTTSETTLADVKTLHHTAISDNMHRMKSHNGGKAKTRAKPCITGVCSDILPVRASGGIGIHDGLKIRSAYSEKHLNTGVSGHPEPDTTSETTPADAKTTHSDAIRAALAGLSRDEIITMLADALAAGEGGQT
jgi:integrase